MHLNNFLENLEALPSINEEDTDGNTPLHYLIKYRSQSDDVIQELNYLLN
jgi:hypothetical protein